jgi:antitoxin component of RelBE/YafQ-DinJ toxin-antitoxin module
MEERITIRVSKEEKERLFKIAKQLGIPVSSLIKMAMHEFITEKRL